MYLAWFDGDRKKSVATKIEEARERYINKFGSQPVVCLVNPQDLIPNAVIELRPLETIGRNCFWIGVDDVAGEAPATTQPPQPTAPRRRKATTAAAHTPGAALPAAPAPTASITTTAQPTRQRRKSPEQPPLPAPTAVDPAPRRSRRIKSAA